tara:strand:+ start:762 stop:1286 length:525 start_codon:yes stop_codon:yes gene_type:complete
MTSELRVDKIIPTSGVPAMDASNSRFYGGGVIQVVQGYGGLSETATTSTSYVPTTLLGRITPKFTTSRILITVSGGTCYAPQGNGIALDLFKSVGGGSYSGFTGTTGRPTSSLWRFYGNGAASQMGCSFQVLDAPNTTSEITYKVYMKSINGGSAQFNNHSNDSAGISIMELSA